MIKAPTPTLGDKGSITGTKLPIRQLEVTTRNKFTIGDEITFELKIRANSEKMQN